MRHLNVYSNCSCANSSRGVQASICTLGASHQHTGTKGTSWDTPGLGGALGKEGGWMQGVGVKREVQAAAG